ncbi:MAG: hypothetical protein OEU76_03260 [Cyclobacteriaceae bacterium]|nr:hypothetical protein [Cyclobacteriaceae bacterium]
MRDILYVILCLLLSSCYKLPEDFSEYHDTDQLYLFKKCKIFFSDHSSTEITLGENVYAYEEIDREVGFLFILLKGEEVVSMNQCILSPDGQALHCDFTGCYFRFQYESLSEDTFFLARQEEGSKTWFLAEDYPYNANNIESVLDIPDGLSIYSIWNYYERLVE